MLTSRFVLALGVPLMVFVLITPYVYHYADPVKKVDWYVRIALRWWFPRTRSFGVLYESSGGKPTKVFENGPRLAWEIIAPIGAALSGAAWYLGRRLSVMQSQSIGVPKQ